MQCCLKTQQEIDHRKKQIKNYEKQSIVAIEYTHLTKLLGFRWQEAHSKNVPEEYRDRFLRGTTLGQCTCLYTQAGLVVCH